MNAVEWTGRRVRFLDQTLLPLRESYLETEDYRDLLEAIRSLRIRGAPAIGVAAAFGVCLAAGEPGVRTHQECVQRAG
ncbi:MAG: S-methyl-5-thioribose-1-phosphate isomerase, partial [Bacteroidota bacterium]